MFCFVLHFDQLFERNSSFLKKTLTRDGRRTPNDDRSRKLNMSRFLRWAKISGSE